VSAVAVASDEGLGGIVPFGCAIRDAGRLPLLLTGPAPAVQIERWRSVYERVEVIEDPYDPGAVAEAASRLASETPLVGLFSCYDGLVVPVARAAAELGLPHPAIDGLERCRNKHLTRSTTRSRGLITPPFGLVSAEEDLDRIVAEVGFPAVVKPLNGLASHLVRRVDGPEELEVAWRCLAAGVHRSYRGNYSSSLRDGQESGVLVDPRTTFLVERFVEGEEYSAEVVVRDGYVHRIALFHKFLVDPDGFLECGFTTPAGSREEELWQHVEQSLEALGVNDCVAHVEVIDSVEGPVLVEVNAGRAGGQIIVRAVRDMLGVDLLRELLAVQCGDPRPDPVECALNAPVTTLSVFPPRSGKLERLNGLDAVSVLPGVRAVIPFCVAGDHLDVDDKEFFAVNLLLSEVSPVIAAEVYDLARELVSFQIDSLAAHQVSPASVQRAPQGSNSGVPAALCADRALPERAVLADPGRREAIVARSALLQWLRARLAKAGFIEVQTPLLHTAAECGCVHQYETRALNGRTLYLRTDPEEHLKRHLTAGLEAVFEVAGNVRGETPDGDHLQEFTSLECYRRNWPFEEAIRFCWALIGEALTDMRGSTETVLHGVRVDFQGAPVVRSFRDLVLDHADIDVNAHPTAAELLDELSTRGMWGGTGGPLDGFRRIALEWLIEERVFPAIREPTFVTDFPVELGLSARERPDRPGTCLRGELYLPGGWELVNLYENLTEPAALRSRYEQRLRHRVAAGLPPVPLDEGLLASAELGMPPMSGIAIGVDRLFVLIRGKGRVGDGLLFPEEGFQSEHDGGEGFLSSQAPT
jgi:elongation factor P--beta-lysine ligase